jgi:hypothetical protein
MKNYILLFLSILLCANISAQPKEKKGFIGILIVPSIPVANFADNSLDNKSAGFAKKSYTNYFIDFGYRFGKNLGLSATYFTSNYKIDSSAADLSWGFGGITAGPMWSTHVADKFFLDLRVNFGYTTADIFVKDNLPKEYSGHGLGIDTRVSLRYNLFRHWCVLAEAGYLSSNQKFGDGRKEKIQIINLGLGFAFRL